MSGHVVFTGKGIDPATGSLRVRGDWCALARSKGFRADPKDKVTPSTVYLVASRDDTSKAAAARAFGTQVISYEQFFALCKGVAIDTSKFDTTPPPPLDTTGMEEVEGWGMF